MARIGEIRENNFKTVLEDVIYKVEKIKDKQEFSKQLIKVYEMDELVDLSKLIRREMVKRSISSINNTR